MLATHFANIISWRIWDGVNAMKVDRDESQILAISGVRQRQHCCSTAFLHVPRARFILTPVGLH